MDLLSWAEMSWAVERRKSHSNKNALREIAVPVSPLAALPPPRCKQADRTLQLNWKYRHKIPCLCFFCIIHLCYNTVIALLPWRLVGWIPLLSLIWCDDDSVMLIAVLSLSGIAVTKEQQEAAARATAIGGWIFWVVDRCQNEYADIEHCFIQQALLRVQVSVLPCKRFPPLMMVASSDYWMITMQSGRESLTHCWHASSQLHSFILAAWKTLPCRSKPTYRPERLAEYDCGPRWRCHKVSRAYLGQRKD